MRTIKEVKQALGGVADTIGKNKRGNFVARRGYFYHHGQSAETFAAEIATVIQGATIVSKWDHYAAFRGGATTAQGSHFGVEFTFGLDEATELQARVEAAERAAGWDANP